MFVENSGGYGARAAKCTLTLPKGLKLEQGEAVSSLGSVKPGETRQLAWRVLPTGDAEGPLKLTVGVASENLEPNQVTREVIVNSPPQLELKLEAPLELTVTPDNHYSPNPFVIRATATNRGAQIGRNVAASLELPNGLRLSEGGALQIAERLAPKESHSFTWSAVADRVPHGEPAGHGERDGRGSEDGEGRAIRQRAAAHTGSAGVSGGAGGAAEERRWRAHAGAHRHRARPRVEFRGAQGLPAL